MKRVWEIDKEMAKRGVVNPFELTEFDSWVNEATRKDINSLVDKFGNNVFGLKFWDWIILKGNELRNICNFGVDIVFLKKDLEKVKEAIEEYRKSVEKKGWNQKLDKQIVDKLFSLALYSAMWV